MRRGGRGKGWPLGYSPPEGGRVSPAALGTRHILGENKGPTAAEAPLPASSSLGCSRGKSKTERVDASQSAIVQHKGADARIRSASRTSAWLRVDTQGGREESEPGACTACRSQLPPGKAGREQGHGGAGWASAAEAHGRPGAGPSPCLPCSFLQTLAWKSLPILHRFTKWFKKRRLDSPSLGVLQVMAHCIPARGGSVVVDRPGRVPHGITEPAGSAKNPAASGSEGKETGVWSGHFRSYRQGPCGWSAEFPYPRPLYTGAPGFPPIKPQHLILSKKKTLELIGFRHWGHRLSVYAAEPEQSMLWPL